MRVAVVAAMAISLPDKGMTRVSRDDEGLDLGGRAQVKRHGGESFFAGPISPTASTQRRPLSARASSEDTGRQGTAQERQQAAHLQGSWCGAPRTSTLLRAVQRGDYEGLVKLLGLANGYDSAVLLLIDIAIMLSCVRHVFRVQIGSCVSYHRSPLLPFTTVDVGRVRELGYGSALQVARPMVASIQLHCLLVVIRYL